MRDELDKKLVEAFPKLYADRNKSERATAMCWGFPGDGWFQLLWDLSEKLEKIIEQEETTCGICRLSEHEPNENCGFSPYWIRASQVKEKFGTLRFYMTHHNKEVQAAIEEAQDLSAVTCESCGAPGELRGTGWVKTLCEKCDKAKQLNKES
jgi:rubrerythrin